MIRPKQGARPLSRWTMPEVLALPPVMPLLTAGDVWDLSRTQTYEMRKQGKLPFECEKVGGEYKVTKGALLLSLGVDALGNPLTPIRPAATDAA